MLTILTASMMFLADGQESLRAVPPSFDLSGPGQYATVRVEGLSAQGNPVDFSSEAAIEVENPGIAMIFQGRVYSLAAGNTALRIRANNQEIKVPVRVGAVAPPVPAFEQDILPLLSRHHCNSSGCHGKAEGQNGFKLSVFGSDPEADYESLAFEARGRRILQTGSGDSLMVKKMSGRMAHGGGSRIPSSHPDYQTVLRWISSGAKQSDPSRPAVGSIRIDPPQATVGSGTTRKLQVFARNANGTEKEITAHCRFYSNQESLALVDQHGTVTMGNLPGEAVVVATYIDKTAVFRAEIPRQGSFQPGTANAGWIDLPIYQKLARLKIPKSPRCSDEDFLRRAYLDLIGQLPTPEEARRFINNKSANKRAQLADELLERPEYADLWALIWSDLLRVDRQALGMKNAYAYYRWIQRAFASNKPLDEFARELISAQGSLANNPQAALFKVVSKPGEISSTASQVFLGRRITCAECHHHPFDRWSQSDYLGMQSFFTGLQWKSQGKVEMLSSGATTPGSSARIKRQVFAYALGEAMPDKQPQGDGRALVAQWMTKPTNPFFAQAMANRIWAHFLGRGLVDPVDDMRDTNPPTHGTLLDDLAKYLITNRFDQKALIRALVLSDAYQRSSAVLPGNEGDEWNYSRYPLKPIMAEVLLDAISSATEVPEIFPGMPYGTRATQLWDSRQGNYFLKVHGRPARVSSCSCERLKEGNIASVLHELNSPGLQRKLSHANGRVARLAQSPATAPEKVDELYLAFLSRIPSPEERETAVKSLDNSKGSAKENWEDLAWSLMNSVEFLFNH
ncbi:MAG: DUF1549 domain-containing protein [Gemmataceae bacterium]|nr:DUF1549 domain-containing protein [Gemmataceae bacterium]